MLVLNVRNVHEALPLSLYILRDAGELMPSRYGQTITYPTAVTTVYEKPTERVLFHPLRDANPFFHFIEALWMLNGQQDVETVSFFTPRMASFSDDGRTLRGAYGYRWRYGFSLDQLRTVCSLLRNVPNTRRAVLQMWNPDKDLFTTEQYKDLPCNQQCMFRIRNGALDMMLTCRSNDIIWGALGANAVHFSMLQEYVAARAGVPVGKLTQVANDWHAYSEVFDPLAAVLADDGDPFRRGYQSPYASGEVHPFGMLGTGTDLDAWDNNLARFMRWLQSSIRRERYNPGLMDDTFFDYVAYPIAMAFLEFKDPFGDRYARAFAELEDCAATDWKRACKEWLERRVARSIKGAA